MIHTRHLVFPFIASLFLSCGDDPIPKPKGYLRLDYPKPKYAEVDISLPFTFEKNKLSSKVICTGLTTIWALKLPIVSEIFLF